MIDKVIKELKEALDSLDITNKYRLNLIRAIEYLQEEPVSDGLEKEMDSYFLKMSVQEHENIFEDTFKNIARHFANWQKQQTINKAYEWIEEINNHHHIMRYADSCEPPLSELTEWFKNYMKGE